MNRKVYITLAVVVVVLIIVAISCHRRAYKWRPCDEPVENGSQPYDLNHFDEYMQLVLPNGYEVRVIDPSNTLSYAELSDIADSKTDEALLVIYNYPWYMTSCDEDCEYIGDESLSYDKSEFNIVMSAASFADRGGKIIIVVGGDISIFSRVENSAGLDRPFDFTDPNPYSKIGMKFQPDYPIDAWTDQDSIVTLQYKFAPFYFDTNTHTKRNDKKFTPLIDYSGNIYAWDISYGTNGGHVYITTLYPYFTNVGLLIPNGDRVREVLLDKVSDRKVVRLQYPLIPNPEPEIEMVYEDSSDNSAVRILTRNPGVWMAWILVIIGSVCMLSRGFMRRHPVTADPTDVDPTTVVSARKRRFSHSPMLNFMYQTSWLYKGRDHHMLFMTNFQRISRMMSRRFGVELNTASDSELGKVAVFLADYTGLSKDEIIADLKFMRDTAKVRMDMHSGKAKYKMMKAEEFSKSQTIVEKYPLA